MASKAIKARGQVTLTKLYDGTEGAKGDKGVGIANTVVEYQVTDTQVQPSDDSGWTNSIPNLSTGSYLWTRTTLFYTDGTTSRSYTISKQSDNTYTAVLTNDSITLPSDSTGKVTDFSNSTGNFLVYDGTYQVDPNTIKIQLVQAVNVTVTLGGNAYTITYMDPIKDTGYFDLSYTYKGVSLTKRVSVSKSKSGENGTTPVIVNISANAQVFTFDSNNHASPTSQNILFKTAVSGTTSIPVYKAIPYDDYGNAGSEIILSNSGTNDKLLQVSQIGSYASVVVTATVGSISDSTTIVRVKDGSSVSPIPDPSNTVSSNTAPTDAKDGDWWNDTSQTPNVLKYRYRDKWVQYELDGYYVKANSISGEAIVANTLEAQKIKYTNSNGTTTNLQTFDFSGMKTLLTDTKGNTYDSMESAVGSTTVVSNIQNIKSLVNQKADSVLVGTISDSVNQLKSVTNWQQISFDDLNYLNTTGNYLITQSANTNFPPGITAGVYVKVDAPRTDRITQTCWKDSNATQSYVRWYDGSNWSSWNQQVTSSTMLSIFKDSWSLGTSVNNDITSQMVSGIVANANQMSLISQNVTIDSPNTQIKGTAWINSAMIANASITNAKIATLDVTKLTGDISNFIQSNWNGTYQSVKINPLGMTISTSKGSTAQFNQDGLILEGSLGTTRVLNGQIELISSKNEYLGTFQHETMPDHDNVDYLMIKLAGWHTSNPSDSDYDLNSAGTNTIRGGDGIGFGVTNSVGTYDMKMSWDSSLVAGYKGRKSGWHVEDIMTWHQQAYFEGGFDVAQQFSSTDRRALHIQGATLANGHKWYGFFDTPSQAGFGTDDTYDVHFYVKGKSYSLYSILSKIGML